MKKALLLGMGIYVQSPGGECDIYVVHPDPHQFRVDLSTNIRFLEWQELCAVLAKSDLRKGLSVKAADWLEASKEICKKLALPRLDFSIHPPTFDYVYTDRPDASLENTPGYTIEEDDGKRAILLNADHFYDPKDTSLEKLMTLGECESVRWKSGEIRVQLTPEAWKTRLATFARLIEAIAQ